MIQTTLPANKILHLSAFIYPQPKKQGEAWF